MYNLKKIGRTTGALYLIVIICAGFSQGVVRETMYVAGDAMLTAQNILDNTKLFNLAMVFDLIAFSTDIAISILLYLMFKSVSKPLALTMACFRLVAHPAIASLNLLNHYAAGKVLESDGFASQFSQLQIAEFSQFFMEMHHLGYIIAGVTFGIHCLLFGYLILRSTSIPKYLGVLIMFSAFGYLAESFGFILHPEYKATLALIVAITAGLGEVTLAFWLVIKGARPT